MALIQPEDPSSWDIRKIEGTTIQPSNGGLTMRWRSVPRNPNKLRQRRNRMAMAEFSPKWDQLTQAQRDGWIAAYGGETEGQDAFYRRNAILRRCFLEPVPDYVAAETPGAVATNEFTYDSTLGKIFGTFNLTQFQLDFFEVRARRTNWRLRSFQPYSSTILVPDSLLEQDEPYEYNFTGNVEITFEDNWPLPPNTSFTCGAGLSLIHEASGEEYRYPITAITVI